MTKKVIFTIVTRSHISCALVLYSCLLKNSKNIDVYTILADELDGYIDVNEYPFPIISYKKILNKNLSKRMTGYYTAYEFCNSLKPFVHNYFLDVVGVTESLYLDCDIYITGDVCILFNEFENASIVLSPHLTNVDCQSDLTEEIELQLLRMGVYNGGCLLVRKCEESLTFLKWWMSRLQWYCLHAGPGIEVDQSWLNFAPSYCFNSRVSRMEGANIAYWNAHLRSVNYNKFSGYEVKDEPVIFFHLSKWNWKEPYKLTPWDQYNPRADDDVWQKILCEYAELLASYEIEETSKFTYSFSKTEDGSIITDKMRRKFLNFIKANDKTDIDIFTSPQLFRENKKDIYSLSEKIVSSYSKFKNILISQANKISFS